MKIKTLCQKSDPIIRVKMPAALQAGLKAKASASRRRMQDEVIKRLAATLDSRYSEVLKEVQSRILLQLNAIYPFSLGEAP